MRSNPILIIAKIILGDNDQHHREGTGNDPYGLTCVNELEQE